MSRSIGVLALLCWAARTESKACQGENLDPDAPLRVGVKYKPPGCADSHLSKQGDTLRIAYTGYTYEDCDYHFDESYYEGFVFKLGEEPVIKGWEHGLANMCVYEKRKLTLPANQAVWVQGNFRST